MSEGKKYEPIPLWLDRKLLKRMGVMGAENKDLLKGYLYGSHECFEILWPQIEVMKEALVGLAEQKVWNYDEGEEDFELNSSNFQLRIYLAQEALKKVEEITNE